MKKFYKENRVFVILMGIALLCVTVIIVMALSYVISSRQKSVYGNRLDGITDVEITSTQKDEYLNSIKENDVVEDAAINIHGKIIYFDITFKVDTSIDEIKSVAVKALELLPDDYKNFYDVQFLMSRTSDDESNTLSAVIGYIKAGASNITWSNNTK